MWYIGGELLPLCLFSDKVSIIEKKIIVQKFKDIDENWSQRDLKLTDTKDLPMKNLADLVTSSSLCALKSFKFNIDFIFCNDPSAWNNIQEYLEIKKYIDSLKVVNDVAERNVALISTFNDSLTVDESEKQKILQVVSEHRRKYPNSNKSTLFN